MDSPAEAVKESMCEFLRRAVQRGLCDTQMATNQDPGQGEASVQAEGGEPQVDSNKSGSRPRLFNGQGEEWFSDENGMGWRLVEGAR